MAAPAASQEAGPPIVAVFDIEDTRPPKTRLSERERADLTAFLSAALTEGGAFRVVPPEQLRATLMAKKRESYRRCFDERCQIEIGKEVAAQKTLATRIIQMGKQCAIIGTLYDLRLSASERAATQKGACGRDQLLEGIEALARSMREAGAVPPHTADRLYKEGVEAYNRGDAETALSRFAAAEKAGFTDWKLANDLYHYWGETYRNLKKDAGKAAEQHQKAVDVSEDKADWPAFWSEYVLGYMAYEQGDAERAIECFSLSRPNIHRMEWIYQNDFYYYWGETLRALKKDLVGARPFYQECMKVSQNLSDSPTYRCLFRQAEMARDAGRKEEAADMMLRAEAAGRAEAGFASEVDRALRDMGKR